MHVTTNFNRCIVCTSRPIGHPEHILPQCIGGKLSADLLCDDCNHRFGTELVNTLCRDPLVQQLLVAMRHKIPKVYKKTYEQPTLIGKSEDGSIVRAKVFGNEIKVIGGKGANGSRIVDAKRVAKIIEDNLSGFGVDPETISEYVEKFQRRPEDRPLSLPSGETIIKKTLPPLINEDIGKTTDIRLPVLIAFEYLALHTGPGIFDAEFDTIRDYIDKNIISDRVNVESTLSDNYSPYHIIRIVPQSKDTSVEIRVFRRLVYSVQFKNYSYNGPDSVYMEDLEDNQSLVSLTLEDYKAGKYCIL